MNSSKDILYQNNLNILKKYVPESAAEILSRWIIEYKVRFKITRSRLTKLGDYTPGGPDGLPSITVNHDLNPHAFLITAVHEFAHHFTFISNGNRVEPHGPEWKKHYADALVIFMKINVFPPDVLYALNRHIKNPAASSCSDPFLQKVLSFYDIKQDDTVLLEHLPVHTLFEFRKKIYVKEYLRRKRILCTCKETGKQYLFQPGVKVLPVE
jgi:hypothetical protein